jgi:hypothetical protein
MPGAVSGTESEEKMLVDMARGQKDLKSFCVDPDDIQFRQLVTFENLDEMDSRKKEKKALYISNTTNGYSKVITIGYKGDQ